jgi:hypothetical protein
VIGLGYVGLPSAAAFEKKIKVIGFDLNAVRIADLKKGRYLAGEVDSATLKAANIEFTSWSPIALPAPRMLTKPKFSCSFPRTRRCDPPA